MFPNASVLLKLLAHNVPAGVAKLIAGDVVVMVDETLSLLPPPPSPQAIKDARISVPPITPNSRFFIFNVSVHLLSIISILLWLTIFRWGGAGNSNI
jgi:hypothetical protein